MDKEEKTLYTKQHKCKECFCNDLCMFLLVRTGVTTTCDDFQKRVRKVVNREIKKIIVIKLAF